ncbi:MAG: ParB/RepB/Spo0J family partition protein [gamma proteobacterium symbiont of Bathyaustriella thionipta]|nr:ParB/RepB/Spo0J family partition protein [gamma proteobacterium symbiont of Bathyaustriella thionipta]MCU7949200.1 ParB/RepB/Spo0J family partition protein [gamma proteobacterium symbiont of Bathyaustriella thionipta]MCU7952066.1 ParB/RepB/Spo0J family partition protein [gamma proteobacterium symbiont of Bathyaustriella thionipta]MCU7955758.1 ParB/RepB/Spo0J family partition protein [gamma proteobacterium symbiont of Bathyaustriella thionipta]MCU7965660.1 ParB/RepB/Spo0J family partition pro
MAGKKRGLGRGLDALLSGGAKKERAVKEKSDGELHNVPVELIQPGVYQPRIDMHPEALEELANSIQAQGVVQPIIIRPVSDSSEGDEQKYEIIAGERRWRASQMAGLSEIPAVIRDVPDQAAIAMALIENIQREELNPIEEASALRRLIDEFNMTHQLAADAVGRSRASVSNLLRLLELEASTRSLLENGDLEMGHARALLALKGEDQSHTARQIVSQGLSVRETERLIKKILNPKVKTEKKSDPNIINLQQSLSDKLGAKVLFQHGNKGRGKMVIHYNNVDELEGIIAHIR